MDSIRKNSFGRNSTRGFFIWYMPKCNVLIDSRNRTLFYSGKTRFKHKLWTLLYSTPFIYRSVKNIYFVSSGSSSHFYSGKEISLRNVCWLLCASWLICEVFRLFITYWPCLLTNDLFLIQTQWSPSDFCNSPKICHIFLFACEIKSFLVV